MKKLLIILLALVMVLGVVACTDKKSADSDNKGDDKKTEAKDKEDDESTEGTSEDEGNGVGFEFEYKSLKLRVASVEEHEYDAESDSYDAPEGKYVIVTLDILEGEEATSELSGLYDCFKMNGIEADNFGISGSMRMTGDKMFVNTDTHINARFDVPADFDVSHPDLSAD